MEQWKVLKQQTIPKGTWAKMQVHLDQTYGSSTLLHAYNDESV